MEQKAIPAKVGLLELARQLGNVSRACKMMGYSRDSFYRFKDRRCATRHLQKERSVHTVVGWSCATNMMVG
jgi:ACT domain-containing protein